MVHSFEETCALLGCGRTKLNQLCKDRKIGFIQERAGCKRRFTDAQIEKYLAGFTKPARRM